MVFARQKIKFQFSIKSLAVFTLICAVVLGMFTWLALPTAIILRDEYNMRKFAHQNGGNVFYDLRDIRQKPPRKPAPTPSIFSGQRVVFVDMSGTQLNDTQVPKLIELVRKLPDVEFLDVRGTEISMDGLYLIIAAQPAPGLLADEEMLIEIDRLRQRNQSGLNAAKSVD
jgi:hypothetical protein